MLVWDLLMRTILSDKLEDIAFYLAKRENFLLMEGTQNAISIFCAWKLKSCERNFFSLPKQPAHIPNDGVCGKSGI
jgi:hypothetical protein